MFEIYIDGQKVFDRKEAGADADFLPSLRALRAIKPKLQERLKAAPAAAPH